MDCQTCETLVEPYADGELDVAQALALERHLEQCPACRQAYTQLRELRRSIREEATYFAAPAELAGKIRAQLPSGDETSSVARTPAWRRAPAAATAGHQRPTRPGRMWASLGLAAAFALLLGTNIDLYRRQATMDPLPHALVDDHVRSLMASHLMDVPSSDQHTVKPWFNGRLDFSPPVQDLKGKGFPLAGGRLDVVHGHPAAVLIYYRNRHPINLFIWPAAENQPMPITLTTERGYNLAHWRQGGMVFWAVSDLNAAELRQFAQLLSRQDLPGTDA